MNSKRLLLPILTLALVSCSSPAERTFKQMVSQLDTYLTQKPCLLTSRKILKDGQESYVYYALKLDKHDIDSGLEKTFVATSTHRGYIRISCTAFDNSSSGDVSPDTISATEKGASEHDKPEGFSTTDLALKSASFSPTTRTFSIYVDYTYQEGGWVCKAMSGGATPELLINDLQHLPQNRPFREAIGIAN